MLQKLGTVQTAIDAATGFSAIVAFQTTKVNSFNTFKKKKLVKTEIGSILQNDFRSFYGLYFGYVINIENVKTKNLPVKTEKLKIFVNFTFQPKHQIIYRKEKKSQGRREEQNAYYSGATIQSSQYISKIDRLNLLQFIDIS
ncbi:hypothetical protein BpHYR1_051310 [Brachionus plicatilis]|uniref:Uncharacterized protein n=1 Tax=Brachionus plicatilis TaxID=10195 RepID=A0A3M7ST58_BRAPC|nr:hypothetical protein BpHYR1_051310 [Brachionus plicatilis]